MTMERRNTVCWAVAWAVMFLLVMHSVGLGPDWQGGTVSTPTGYLMEKLGLAQDEPMPIDEAQRVIDEYERKLMDDTQVVDGVLVVAATDGGLFMQVHDEFHQVMEVEGGSIRVLRNDAKMMRYEIPDGMVVLSWEDYRTINGI